MTGNHATPVLALDLDEVLDCLPTGVLVIDREDRIALINRSATLLLREGVEISGRLVAEAVLATHLPAMERVLAQVRAQGYALPAPLSVDVGDEQVTPVSLSGSAPRVGDRVAVLVVQDTSAADELARRARRDERKKDLVTETAHEVMNPMTTILGMLELLNMAPDPALARKYVARALVAANRLHRLVRDTLEDSRIERRAVTMRRVLVDLRSVIEAVAPLDLKLELDLEPDLPLVPVDPARFERVVSNLLDNAAKYSPPDATIVVRARRVDAAIEMSVTDTGMGIAPEDIPYLFDRHFRPRGHAVRSIPGTGLGLAIVRTIVEAHGGTISVESAPGAGSTFRVRLPAE